jgi:PKD repeat protein
LINHARGVVKAMGGRLPKCSAEAFARKVTAQVPIYQIDPSGTISQFATGFSAVGSDGLEFSLDGQTMYVADVVDGNFYRITVIPTNSPPVADAGGPYNGLEGSAVAFDGSASSDPDSDLLMFDWDFGDPLDPTAGSGPTPSHTYANQGFFDVTVTVTDPDGLTNTSAVVAAEIANVSPTVGPITAPVEPVIVGTEVTVGADFTDPGTLDTHTGTIDWSDGPVSPATVSEMDGSGSVSGMHTYTTPGVYPVTATVTDDDGGVAASIFEFVVVFDPDGGFVTGGGSINSAAGAYRWDPLAEGKAGFGFVSKYKKGATVPTGNTQFRFKAGDLNFHSSSYEFLVVTMGGTNAQFKGSGTINGGLAPNGTEFRFMIWARDDSADTFRIRIWWENGGENVVYDNGFNQPISGGSIVIHTK